jgi:hypothetical protein
MLIISPDSQGHFVADKPNGGLQQQKTPKLCLRCLMSYKIQGTDSDTICDLFIRLARPKGRGSKGSAFASKYPGCWRRLSRPFRLCRCGYP